MNIIIFSILILLYFRYKPRFEINMDGDVLLFYWKYNHTHDLLDIEYTKERKFIKLFNLMS